MSTVFKTTAAALENADFHEDRYQSIQTLRGIAALFVILEHIRFLNCGAFGVDIFFCISGFMIMLTTHKDTRFFFRKRLIRILPLYYIMTLFTWTVLVLFPGMFEQTTPQPVFLIKSLLFIPFDIGGGILQPLMRIGWTVNCEMFFYLLFFISFHISHKFRGLICCGLLGAVVAFNYLLPVSFAPPFLLRKSYHAGISPGDSLLLCGQRHIPSPQPRTPSRLSCPPLRPGRAASFLCSPLYQGKH